MRRPAWTAAAIVAVVAAGLVTSAAVAPGVAVDLDPTNAFGSSSSEDESEPGEPVEVPPPQGACIESIEEPAFAEGTEAEQWSGDVPAQATTGRLHIQSYHAGIYLETWDKDTYSVEIAESDPFDRLEPTVEGTAEGGVFVLDVRVEDTLDTPETPAPVSADVDVETPDTFAQVKVRVPRLDALNVTALDGPRGENATIHVGPRDPRSWIGNDTLTNGTPLEDPGDDRWHAILAGDLQGDRLRVQADDLNVGLHGLEMDTVDVGTDNGNVAIHDVDGTRMALETDNGNACASGATLTEAVRAETDNGNVELDGVTTTRFEATTDNGNVEAAGIGARDVVLDTDNGNADLDLIPSASGHVQLDSDNGNVHLAVPVGSPYGYDVSASTDNGNANVDLGSTQGSADGHDDPHVHVQTPNYDSAEIQVVVEAVTDNGNVGIGGR